MNATTLSIAAATILGALWFLRFDVVSNGDQAYVLDRLTGNVSHCVADVCRDVQSDGPWIKYQKRNSK